MDSFVHMSTFDALLQLYCDNDISKVDRNKLFRICSHMRESLRAKRATTLKTLANLDNEEAYLQKIEHIISVLADLSAGKCRLFNNVTEFVTDYVAITPSDPVLCANLPAHRVQAPEGILEHQINCCVERELYWTSTESHAKYKYVYITTRDVPARTMYMCTAPGLHIGQYLEDAYPAEEFYMHHKDNTSANLCCGGSCHYCGNVAYGTMTIAAVPKPGVDGKWTLDNCNDSQGAFELLWFLRVLGSS